VAVKIDPDAAGMDAGRLARIDEHLRTRYLEPGKIAGCQVVVARHGAVAHASSLGERDRERGRPVTDDTIWRLYSMTKPVTGVALLTLYERGLFQLDDPAIASCRRGATCMSGSGPRRASAGW
jgi:CubicO group peptidase (beta-lactamase class C family)